MIQTLGTGKWKNLVAMLRAGSKLKRFHKAREPHENAGKYSDESCCGEGTEVGPGRGGESIPGLSILEEIHVAFLKERTVGRRGWARRNDVAVPRQVCWVPGRQEHAVRMTRVWGDRRWGSQNGWPSGSCAQSTTAGFASPPKCKYLSWEWG